MQAYLREITHAIAHPHPRERHLHRDFGVLPGSTGRYAAVRPSDAVADSGGLRPAGPGQVADGQAATSAEVERVRGDPAAGPPRTAAATQAAPGGHPAHTGACPNRPNGPTYYH